MGYRSSAWGRLQCDTHTVRIFVLCTAVCGRRCNRPGSSIVCCTTCLRVRCFGLCLPTRCVEGCPRKGPGLRVRAEWRAVMLCVDRSENCQHLDLRSRAAVRVSVSADVSIAVRIRATLAQPKVRDTSTWPVGTSASDHMRCGGSGWLGWHQPEAQPNAPSQADSAQRRLVHVSRVHIQ